MHSQIEGYRYNTMEYVLHPKFINETKHDDYDMAIAVVDREIHFNRHVVPICLPFPIENVDNKFLTVAGW